MKARIIKNKSGEFVPVLTHKDFFGKETKYVNAKDYISDTERSKNREKRQRERIEKRIRQREIDEERRAKEARRAAFDAWWEEKQQCEKWGCTPPERPNLWN